MLCSNSEPNHACRQADSRSTLTHLSRQLPAGFRGALSLYGGNRQGTVDTPRRHPLIVRFSPQLGISPTLKWETATSSP
jgi:hypothetical protein